MGRIEKTIGIALFFILLVLIVLLFMQNLSPNKNELVYSVSVLVDDLHEYAQMGMDKAALAYNLDVHYVSGFDRNAAQQAESIQREIENGVNALIVSAADAEYISSYLDEAHVSIPVITLGDKLISPAVTAHIAPDQYALGYSLGARMLEASYLYPCLVILEQDSPAYLRERCEGLTSAFEEGGRTIECRYVENSAEAVSALMQDRRATCIAVVDEAMLPALCEGSRFYDKLFGAGYDRAARAALENGNLNTLVVYSAFDEGYTSMRYAYQAIRSPSLSDFVLQAVVVDKTNMYLPPQEQMLFPIS